MLLDQEAFADNGSFTAKSINGRKYWYFQTGTGVEGSQRYVGPETPELLERIAHHKEVREDERERRALYPPSSARSNFRALFPELGDVFAALAKAGVFRRGSVRVGTIAYQT